MSHKLLTVASFGTAAEAAIARSSVEAEGVPVYVTGGEIVDAMWYYGIAVGGVKLQVSEDDVNLAVCALQTKGTVSISEEDWRSRNIDDLPVAELNEIEVGHSPANEITSRALRASVFGLLMPPFLLYSLWLLLKIAADSVPLSNASRIRVLVIVMFNLLTLSFIWAVL